MSKTKVAAVIVLFLAAPHAVAEQAGKSLDAEADWEQASGEVIKELHKRDVIEWSNQLATQLEKADRRTLFTALHVFIRSGRTERVSDVMRRLCRLSLTRPVHENIAHVLITNKLWDSIRILLDAHPAFRPGDFQNYRSHWWQTGDKAELQVWLKARYEADWPTWHGDYYWVLFAEGKIVPLIEKLRKEIHENPTDFQFVRKYLGAIDTLPHDKRPKIAWLGDVARPKYAMDAYDLGRTLANKSHHAEAIKLFDHSLSRPITDYDMKAVRERCSAVIHEPEKLIRRWTKAELAYSCKEAGQIERAQKLVEELLGPEGTLNHIEMLRFAGQVQTQSGQRVIEKRIIKKEIEKKDSVQYWLGRAQYYIGRKEFEKAEEAFKTAMALPPGPDGSRSDAVRGYFYYLRNKKGRINEAAGLLREEIKRIGPSHDSSEYLIHRLLELDREKEVTFSFDDLLLWQFLTERKRYDYTAECVLRALLDKSHATGQTKAFWAKVISLAGPDTDPTRRKVIGWMLSRHGQPARALPIVKDALRRWPKADNARRSVAFNLFEIYLDLNDWKSAEKVFLSEAHKQLTSGEVPYWFSRIAVIAAQTGAKDDSMRLWKQRANLDLNNLEGMGGMIAAGMKDRLREFYSGLAKRDSDNKAVAAALKALE